MANIAKGDTEAAIQELTLFLNSDFVNDEALFMLGACMMSKGLNGLSYVLTSAALEARQARSGKSFPEAMMNLGAACKAEHQHDNARRIWLDALDVETLPVERAKIMTNLSGLHVGEGCPEKAIEWCDRAIAEDPQNRGARTNRGIACLEMGRWREGWEGYAHTYATGDRTQRRYGELPVWDGSPGKHVIVFGDQGVGDELFYASCLPDMARVCRKVTFDCHPRLVNLFRRSFPDMAVHGTRKDLTELRWMRTCDAEASIGLADLPQFFRNTDAEWGSGAAYLRADPGLPKQGLRIGVSWTGGSKRTRTDLRSIPIDMLLPILRARPDAHWHSLQYTPDAAREVCELEERSGVRISHYPGWVECFDYDRTASFVSGLDLIVTVTTAVHDLAGGLGVPNWVLTPSRAPWRFQLKGERLLWYASTRLFRQERDGDWSHPVQRIAEELAGVDNRGLQAA